MADLIAPMPAAVLYWNCRVVFEAIDPASGAPVSGVTVTNPAVYGVNLLGTEPDQTDGTEAPAPLPLFVAIDTAEQEA